MKPGRPTKMTPTTLQKLHEAFLWGCSDREACLWADINPDTLYCYQEANPEYSEQKEAWKSCPNIKARRTLVRALDKDPNLALKYLERKLPREFSPHPLTPEARSPQISITEFAKAV